MVLDFENVFVDPNLLTSHILCLNETKMNFFDINSKFYTILWQEFQILSCYDEHGTIILYDDNVSSIDTTMTHSKTEFNTAFFNNNTHDSLYVIMVYKPPKNATITFLLHVRNIWTQNAFKLSNYDNWNFNIDLLTNTIQSTTLQAFMKKYNFKLTYYGNTTISDKQIDHIWTNAPTQQNYYGSTQAYWIVHEPIYLAFQLLDYGPQFLLPQWKETIYWIF